MSCNVDLKSAFFRGASSQLRPQTTTLSLSWACRGAGARSVLTNDVPLAVLGVSWRWRGAFLQFRPQTTMSRGASSGVTTSVGDATAESRSGPFFARGSPLPVGAQLRPGPPLVPVALWRHPGCGWQWRMETDGDCQPPEVGCRRPRAVAPVAPLRPPNFSPDRLSRTQTSTSIQCFPPSSLKTYWRVSGMNTLSAM